MAPRAPENTQAAVRSGPLAALARLDDAVIVRTAFYALLAGSVAMLVIDYRELSASTVSDYIPQQTPVLPAVNRPEIDPDNPAYRPTQRITTDPAILAGALTVELVGGGALLLQGVIDPGSPVRVAEELETRGEYVTSVALDSPGGSVTDAIAIAELLREGGYDTEVRSGALCASSCPLVLAAGVERHASATAAIGVHQIYSDAGNGLAAGQAMSDAQVTTAQIVRHLVAMEVDTALWLHALDTPPDRLYYLTPEELELYGLATEVTD